MKKQKVVQCTNCGKQLSIYSNSGAAHHQDTLRVQCDDGRWAHYGDKITKRKRKSNAKR